MRINLTTPMSDDKERQRQRAVMIDAIERYTEERMNDEYGRIHTDGSRSGGQPLHSDVERVARALAQADGIEICSDATYALSSYGHKAQAALAAMRQSTQSDALREALEAAPLIGRTESVYDFMERQNAWLKGPYRAALERSK